MGTSGFEAACRALLVNTRVSELQNHHEVLTLKDTATIEEALQVLAEHRVLSAPVVTVLSEDDLRFPGPAWPADKSAGDILGFLDVRDILCSFLHDLAPELPDLLRANMLQRLRRLEKLCAPFAKKKLNELAYVGFDGGFLHTTQARATLLELILVGLLDPKSRGVHGGDEAPRIVHRVALFNSEGHVTTVISQTDIVRLIAKRQAVLGDLAKATVASLGWAPKVVEACAPDTCALEALLLMLRAGVSSLAVVCPNTGRLLGNFSVSEMRSMMAEHLSALAMSVGEFLAHSHDTEFVGYNVSSPSQWPTGISPKAAGSGSGNARRFALSSKTMNDGHARRDADLRGGVSSSRPGNGSTAPVVTSGGTPAALNQIANGAGTGRNDVRSMTLISFGSVSDMAAKGKVKKYKGSKEKGVGASSSSSAAAAAATEKPKPTKLMEGGVLRKMLNKVDAEVVKSPAHRFVSDATQRRRRPGEGCNVGEAVGQQLPVVGVDATFGEVLDLLVSHQCHRVYVVDREQRPLGVITHTDVLRTLLTTAQSGGGGSVADTDCRHGHGHAQYCPDGPSHLGFSTKDQGGEGEGEGLGAESTGRFGFSAADFTTEAAETSANPGEQRQRPAVAGSQEAGVPSVLSSEGSQAAAAKTRLTTISEENSKRTRQLDPISLVAAAATAITGGPVAKDSPASLPVTWPSLGAEASVVSTHEGGSNICRMFPSNASAEAAALSLSPTESCRSAGLASGLAPTPETLNTTTRPPLWSLGGVSQLHANPAATTGPPVVLSIPGGRNSDDENVSVVASPSPHGSYTSPFDDMEAPPEWLLDLLALKDSATATPYEMHASGAAAAATTARTARGNGETTPSHVEGVSEMHPFLRAAPQSVDHGPSSSEKAAATMTTSVALAVQVPRTVDSNDASDAEVEASHKLPPAPEETPVAFPSALDEARFLHQQRAELEHRQQVLHHEHQQQMYRRYVVQQQITQRFQYGLHQLQAQSHERQQQILQQQQQQQMQMLAQYEQEQLQLQQQLIQTQQRYEQGICPLEKYEQQHYHVQAQQLELQQQYEVQRQQLQLQQQHGLQCQQQYEEMQVLALQQQYEQVQQRQHEVYYLEHQKLLQMQEKNFLEHERVVEQEQGLHSRRLQDIEAMQQQLRQPQMQMQSQLQSSLSQQREEEKASPKTTPSTPSYRDPAAAVDADVRSVRPTDGSFCEPAPLELLDIASPTVSVVQHQQVETGHVGEGAVLRPVSLLAAAVGELTILPTPIPEQEANRTVSRQEALVFPAAPQNVGGRESAKEERDETKEKERSPSVGQCDQEGNQLIHGEFKPCTTPVNPARFPEEGDLPSPPEESCVPLSFFSTFSAAPSAAAAGSHLPAHSSIGHLQPYHEGLDHYLNLKHGLDPTRVPPNSLPRRHLHNFHHLPAKDFEIPEEVLQHREKMQQLLSFTAGTGGGGVHPTPPSSFSFTRPPLRARDDEEEDEEEEGVDDDGEESEGVSDTDGGIP